MKLAIPFRDDVVTYCSSFPIRKENLMKTMRDTARVSLVALLTVTFLCVFQGAALAQGQEDGSVMNQVKWEHGPCVSSLDKWAQIDVPEGFVFANGSDTRLLMEAMGNVNSGTEVGFIAPNTLDWFVVFEFDKIGYVKDDEKDNLDSAAILESIRKGTEAGNKVRKERGFPTLHIVGWEVEPHYNDLTNNLEWAIRAENQDGSPVLNHNTRLLGRRGVMKSTLVVDPETFGAVLPLYRSNLDGFVFKSGQSYAEFTKGDKVAKYGLTALVAGGAGAAAAKLGLFKILGKYFKVVIVAVIAFFAGIWKFLKSLFSGGSRKSEEVAEPEPQMVGQMTETDQSSALGSSGSSG